MLKYNSLVIWLNEVLFYDFEFANTLNFITDIFYTINIQNFNTFNFLVCQHFLYVSTIYSVGMHCTVMLQSSSLILLHRLLIIQDKNTIICT